MHVPVASTVAVSIIYHYLGRACHSNTRDVKEGVPSARHNLRLYLQNSPSHLHAPLQVLRLGLDDKWRTDGLLFADPSALRVLGQLTRLRQLHLKGADHSAVCSMPGPAPSTTTLILHSLVQLDITVRACV